MGALLTDKEIWRNFGLLRLLLQPDCHGYAVTPICVTRMGLYVRGAGAPLYSAPPLG